MTPDPQAQAEAEAEAERLLAELAAVEAGPQLPGALLATRGNPLLSGAVALGGSIVVVVLLVGLLTLIGAML